MVSRKSQNLGLDSGDLDLLLKESRIRRLAERWQEHHLGREVATAAACGGPLPWAPNITVTNGSGSGCWGAFLFLRDVAASHGAFLRDASFASTETRV